MKTIQIEDSMYEQLMAIANEIATQDNRATGKPYLFQVRTDRKVWIANLNGDHKVLLDNDREEIDPFDANTVERYCDDRELEIPDWVPALRAGMASHWDYDDWITQRGLFLESYSIAHDLKNGFLTAKGCQEHIKANAHHYDNPTDYLSHAGRNPELDLVFKFLGSLVEKGKEPKSGMGFDFNNLRRQACRSHDALVNKLNNAILKTDQYALPNDISHGCEVSVKGYVLVDAEELGRDLENLRMQIATIAMVHEPNSEEFADVFDKPLLEFNPEIE